MPAHGKLPVVAQRRRSYAVTDQHDESQLVGQRRATTTGVAVGRRDPRMRGDAGVLRNVEHVLHGHVVVPPDHLIENAAHRPAAAACY